MSDLPADGEAVADIETFSALCLHTVKSWTAQQNTNTYVP